MKPALSLIIPANNEAAHISACLVAVLASDPLEQNTYVQIIVVPNGCSDETSALANSFKKKIETRGWSLDIIELEQGSKLAALNAADAKAEAPAMAYLDADVIIHPQLLAQTATALAADTPRYVSGAVVIARAKSWVSNAYARFYQQTPFMKQIAPGCGYFAMNSAGRARWAEWPAIISDDTFARLTFAQNERIQVDARYEWPLVEGLKNLIKVRRRQNAGVDELVKKFPELVKNDAKTAFTPAAVMCAVLKHPIGTIVYGLVSVTVKLTPDQNGDWKRGR